MLARNTSVALPLPPWYSAVLAWYSAVPELNMSRGFPSTVTLSLNTLLGTQAPSAIAAPPADRPFVPDSIAERPIRQ